MALSNMHSHCRPGSLLLQFKKNKHKEKALHLLVCVCARAVAPHIDPHDGDGFSLQNFFLPDINVAECLRRF